MRRAILLAIATVLVGACEENARAVTARADPARCAALQPGDSVPTSRSAFLYELFNPQPTTRTGKFDDYHEESYHVTKADLAEGLLELTRACGLPLSGALVVGPTGGLWAYHVAVFMQEPDGRTLVNSILMPHARITRKATGVLPAGSIDSLLMEFASSPLLGPGPIPAAVAGDSSPRREFRYDVLLLRVDRDSVTVRSGTLLQAPDTTAVHRLLERVNVVLRQLKQTYPAEAARSAER